MQVISVTVTVILNDMFKTSFTINEMLHISDIPIPTAKFHINGLPRT